MTQQMREVKVLCTPRLIPESIDVDVSGLTLDHAIHVSDLKVEEGVEIHGDMDAIVASLVFVKEPELEPTPEEEIAEPELIGEEGAEGEEPAEGESESDEPVIFNCGSLDLISNFRKDDEFAD